MRFCFDKFRTMLRSRLFHKQNATHQLKHRCTYYVKLMKEATKINIDHCPQKHKMHVVLKSIQN